MSTFWNGNSLLAPEQSVFIHNFKELGENTLAGMQLMKRMNTAAYKDHSYFADCLYSVQSIIWVTGNQHFHLATTVPNALVKQKIAC